MAQDKKKDPKRHLPKKVKPADVMVPGNFGSRVIRGVAGALKDVNRSGNNLRRKPRRKKKR